MNKFKKLLEQLLHEESYKAFFQKALKKYGVKSPKDFKDSKDKKAFFDYVEKNWSQD